MARVSAREESSERDLPSVLRILRERIEAQLWSGSLEHGDRLWSVRELAEELKADPRVVIAAYHELVEAGLVEVRSRSGVFLTGQCGPADGASTIPRRWMLETLLGTIQRDIPPLRLAEQVRSMFELRRLRAAVLECNDDQLHSMREELCTYFGIDAVAISLDAVVSGEPHPEMRDVDLLISAGHEEAVARVAAAIRKPYVITRVRPALIYRLTRLLARGPVYFLVADPRFGAKMRRLIAPMAHSENLHVLVVDRDDLRVIPRGAPTYVMRTAHGRMAEKQHLGREIRPQRIFSEETTREILSRILAVSPATTTTPHL